MKTSHYSSILGAQMAVSWASTEERKQSIDGLTEESLRDFCWQAGKEILKKEVLLSLKFVSFGC